MIHIAKQIWYGELNGYIEYLFKNNCDEKFQFKGATTSTKDIFERKIKCVKFLNILSNFYNKL
jgi:hypothetical protein